jgi:hypothetical protein
MPELTTTVAKGKILAAVDQFMQNPVPAMRDRLTGTNPLTDSGVTLRSESARSTPRATTSRRT